MGFKLFNIFLTLIILVTSIYSVKPKVYAEGENNIDFNIYSESTMQTIGGNFNISVCAKANNDYKLSVFRLILNFDNGKLTFDKLTSKGQTVLGNVKMSENGGQIIILYLEGITSIDMKSGVDTELFDIKFTVNDESFIGDTSISIVADGVGDNFSQRINVMNEQDLKLQIVNPIPASCKLKSIIPSVGNLNEEFNPDVTSYTMDVESSVSSVTFDVESEDENASVKLNRKTLLKQGSSTDINITVTASDGSDKIVYTVTVNRKTKESDEVNDESDEGVKNSSTKSSSSYTSKSSSSKSSLSKLSSSKTTSSNTNSSKTSSNKIQSNSVNNVNINDTISDSEEYVDKHVIMKENNFGMLVTIVSILGCAALAGLIVIKYKN